MIIDSLLMEQMWRTSGQTTWRLSRSVFIDRLTVAFCVVFHHNMFDAFPLLSIGGQFDNPEVEFNVFDSLGNALFVFLTTTAGEAAAEVQNCAVRDELLLGAQHMVTDLYHFGNGCLAFGFFDNSAEVLVRQYRIGCRYYSRKTLKRLT